MVAAGGSPLACRIPAPDLRPAATDLNGGPQSPPPRPGQDGKQVTMPNA